MEKIYFIIPAYNEEENIGQVIDDWYDIVTATGPQSRLIIIDDGSKDHTYEILKQKAASRPQLIPLTKPNGGHGATILYGYKYALKEGADYIFQTDSDGQTIPAEFQSFYDQRSEYDMLIGNRVSREDGLSRKFVTKILKFVLFFCFHQWIPDANTPFRLMKASVLAQYMEYIPEDFNLTNVLISVIFAKKNCKVKYLPITFRPRQGGVNSINLRKIVSIGQKAMKDFIELNRRI